MLVLQLLDQEHSQYPVVVVPSILQQEHHTPTTTPDPVPKPPVPVSGDSDREQNNRCYVPSQTHTIQTNIDPANNTEQTHTSQTNIDPANNTEQTHIIQTPANNSEQTHTSQTNIDPANNTEQTVPNGEHAEKHSGIKKVTILNNHVISYLTFCIIDFAF